MATLTANDFAQQMIAQARVLDPSFSGEVGTPERKIIDTVAQALADNQVDLTGLASALDIDSKYGSNLDRFTALFGMERQQAVAATGFVIYSRNTPAPENITIPIGATIQANSTDNQTGPMQYTTTANGTIPINGTDSGAIPVQAISTGQAGNAAADTLTVMVGTPVPGVTSVTNPNALTNGTDVEDDNSYKTRFKNTWARNLAGTQDQYLALALATPYTTKANVVGLQSRYQEYIQIPDFDDAGYLSGSQTVTQSTSGIQGQWTSAQSTIPYAKQVYLTTPAFISNGQSGPDEYFYRPGTDFNFNGTPVMAGDTLREIQTTVSGLHALPAATINVVSTLGFPSSGSLVVGSGSSWRVGITYTGKTATSFTGCANEGTGSISGGSMVYLIPTSIAPNFTFFNVNDTGNTTPGLQAVAPGNIILSEFSYVSSASRNDLQHNVNNAVDIYIDGDNGTDASCVFLTRNVTNQMVTQDYTSPWYYENFRRDGQTTKRPQIGNFITPLFQSPLLTIPSVIIINNQNYYLGWHYWLVHEVDALSGSIRARDGIEWSNDLGGDIGSQQPPDDPTRSYSPTGATIGTISAANTPIEVDDYLYDTNVVTLQATVEKAAQVTTDALVHSAKSRYFKLDVTVMYTTNTNYAAANAAIGASVQAFFDRQYFGTVIQLSDLLDVIHQVQGVDNVRWSNDLLSAPDLIRVLECDVNGNPLHGASIDRLTYGGTSITEQQTLYIVGSPSGTTGGFADNFVLSWSDPALPGSHVATTLGIPFFNTINNAPLTATDVQTAIRTAMTSLGVSSGIYNNITVTADARPSSGVTQPILSFTITYGAVGKPVLPAVTNNVTVSSLAYNSDFFLQDNELPTLPTNALATDTGGIPGLIIRPRAQNTWTRPGLG